ncbi:MAG TPA: glycosyltransferase, partial [Bacteroidales bacterium]|nr:glycosyltransferase [Bacteroidales bacterium]
MILSLAIGCFVVDGWSFWLSVLFLIFFIVQLIFYGFIYRKAYAVDTVTIAEQHPVSVIVAARNDAPGLKKLLPELLRQQYGCFEIIVADDRSVDDTREVVTTFIGKSDKIRYLKVEPCVDEIPGKKLALSKAIRQAKYELLLFTDADCVPSSPNWILLMASACKPNTDLVLGYGAYVAEKTCLNTLIRYDTQLIALQYLGMANAQMPYMGVGRNLLYRKSLWQSTNGFTKHSSVASGDDDLFVQQAVQKSNHATVLHRDATTFSVAKSEFSLWRNQKIRHLTTAPFSKLV